MDKYEIDGLVNRWGRKTTARTAVYSFLILSSVINKQLSLYKNGWEVLRVEGNILIYCDTEEVLEKFTWKEIITLVENIEV